MKFLTSIRPGAIAKRPTKKIGSAKKFISGSGFFGSRGSKSGTGGLSGLAQGKIKPAPNGISSLISNISQTLGGETNNVNITKLIGDKISQSVSKISGSLPNFDGVMNSLSGMADYMKSITDPSMLDGLTSGLSSVKSSLEGTVDLVSTVQKVITKLVKQLNELKPPKGGGGGGGLLGGLGMGIAGLAGGGAMAAAGKKGLGFAKFLSSKKSLALMGLGAVGASAMGASQAQAADVSTEQRMLDASGGDGMPSDQIALFNSTVSKFEKYLDDAKKKRSSGPGTKGKGSNSGNPPLPPGPPVISSAPGEANLAAFVATLESSGLQDQADVLQSMSNRAGQNWGGLGGLFGQLTAPNQYSPLSAIIHGTTDPAAQARYGPIAAKLGATPAERLETIKKIIAKPDALSQLENLYNAGNAKNAKKLLDDFYVSGPLQKEAARFIQGRTDFGASSGVGGAQGTGQIKRTSNTFGAANANKGASSLAGLAPQTVAQTQTQLNLTAQTQLQQLGSIDPLDAQATYQQQQQPGGLTIVPLPPPPQPNQPKVTPQVAGQNNVAFFSPVIVDPNTAAACAIYNICPVNN